MTSSSTDQKLNVIRSWYFQWRQRRLISVFSYKNLNIPLWYKNLNSKWKELRGVNSWGSIIQGVTSSCLIFLTRHLFEGALIPGGSLLEFYGTCHRFFKSLRTSATMRMYLRFNKIQKFERKSSLKNVDSKTIKGTLFCNVPVISHET